MQKADTVCSTLQKSLLEMKLNDACVKLFPEMERRVRRPKKQGCSGSAALLRDGNGSKRVEGQRPL